MTAGMQPLQGFLGARARSMEPRTGKRNLRTLDKLPASLPGRALNAVSESSLITDETQKIIYANAAFTTVTGFSQTEVLGRNCRLLQGPGTDPVTVAALRATLARGETYRGEILNYRRDGTPFWNALTISPLRDDTGTITHFVSVQRDVTERKTLQDRLRFLALHDPVTGLPNRTALDQRLARRTGRGPAGDKAVAVGIIDLDDFKFINDRRGPLSVAPEAPVSAEYGPETDLPVAGPHPYLHRLFNGGLQMFYQPVVDMRTGKLRLLEALARFKLKDGTVLPPAAFLPLLTAEDTDQLFKTGMDAALGQLSAWDDDGHRLLVSINLPPSALLNPGCAQWVASALDRHNIAPHRLVVELLENHVEDFEIQSRAFNELITLGVGMAMDDLGAGHSSLRRLTALAFSTVKIDHRILAQLRTSPIPTLTFLATMIQIGRDMGWDVIAEGLEDAGITEAAAILGIPYGQGYHLAHPMPAGNVPAWIADFTLPPHAPIRTFPGALAYHWKLARLDSPHPGPLQACPLTEFLARAPSAGTAMKWHRQQHAGAGDHLESATDLLHWLTSKITGDDHTGSEAAAPGPGPPSLSLDPPMRFGSSSAF